MKLYGLQKLSMVDYPGKVAATVFTGGCNLRCPFCHNALLVTRLSESIQLDTDQVLGFLQKRRGLLDGVVLSGGEPLLQPDAAQFLGEVKALGFAVKLDTNGCYPDALERILEAGLVDYVAMDVKNAPNRYAETVGRPGFDVSPVERSIRLLKQGRVDYEFRTTLVRQFHTLEDVCAIGRWLRGAERYALQNFEDSGNLIGSALEGFTRPELEAFSEAVRPCFGQVILRGV